MGYYCTVPQCTSLAGKTKNVKFHRFPRDEAMANKWNVILKRGKPFTKYSKVCSLHFTQADYNVTTMGQWKTLSKDAVPSQNLPKLHPDGTVMVIRKSRTVKYKDIKKEEPSSDKPDKWSSLMGGCVPPPPPPPLHPHAHPLPHPQPLHHGLDAPHPADAQEASIQFRLQSLNAIANSLTGPAPNPLPLATKPKKQDAIMQTDPQQTEDEDNQPGASRNSHSETSEASYGSEQVEYPPAAGGYQKSSKTYEAQSKSYESPKDYTKTNDDYIPQTNEEYNKEAEKYALERKSHNGYEKIESSYTKAVENGYPKTSEGYPKTSEGYPKLGEVYAYEKDYPRPEYGYPNGYQDSADVLRNQQHNLQMLQEQRDGHGFFEGAIKQETDLGQDEEKYLYNRTKEALAESNPVYSEGQRRLLQQSQQQRFVEQLQHHVKQEPDAAGGCENVMQPQSSPYYPSNGHNNLPGYYEQRPGAELLIAKQNALAAHSQLWQNSMKRPFYYSEATHFTQLHRYEDISRIMQ